MLGTEKDRRGGGSPVSVTLVLKPTLIIALVLLVKNNSMEIIKCLQNDLQTNVE